MNDYEDTEAYWEEWGDLEEEETVEEIEELNRALDILDLDRIARENGDKPANEWVREDFKDLLHAYPKLRGLKLEELCALFLEYTGSIDEVIYCKQLSMEEARHRQPFYALATWILANRSLDELEEAGYKYAFQWQEAEDSKLWRIWRSLCKPRRVAAGGNVNCSRQ